MKATERLLESSTIYRGEKIDDLGKITKKKC